MIAYIHGSVLDTGEQSAIIVVNGIGYDIMCPSAVLASLRVGENVELYTHQHLREDASDLYGFMERDALQLFKQLIQVNGVGPRMALAILSAFSAGDIRNAIMNSDITVLSSVSGVGKKTAERIIIDMKDAVGVLGERSSWHRRCRAVSSSRTHCIGVLTNGSSASIAFGGQLAAS